MIATEAKKKIEDVLGKTTKLEASELAIVLALMQMRRLNDEQRVDIIQASINFHRSAIIMSFVQTITNDFTLKDPEKIMSEVAFTTMVVSKKLEKHTERFFTLCEMIGEEWKE